MKTLQIRKKTLPHAPKRHRVDEGHVGAVTGRNTTEKSLRESEESSLRKEGVHRDGEERIQPEHGRREAQLAQSRKMDAIGMLAEGMTHDFNNILSGILGLAEIVRTRCLTPESPARGYLEDILNAGDSAKEFIAQIRLLTAAGKENRSVCRLDEVLKEIVPLMEATLPAGAVLKTEMRWKKAAILADAAQIRQMLLNLMMNAVQALGPSPGEIDVSLDRVECLQRLLPHPDLRSGTFAQLTVADTGRGISVDNMSRIFDPYFTTRKQEGGKGLGLSAAYGIAKRHGGAITVESEVGKGSVFTVYLPVISGKDTGNNEMCSITG
jgi:signal transduction histidine kinase